MSDYWIELLNYNHKRKNQKKMYKYFRTEVDSGGEAKAETIIEVNFADERDRIKEQIQEDLITYCEDAIEPVIIDEMCEIVVKNFKGFE